MAGGVGAVTLLATAARPGSEYAFFDPIIEIKKIRTAQDRVDAKSVLILKWLEFQR